jgi:hypothetical protein
MVHRLPFQRSASGAADRNPMVTSPTAVQVVADAHETASSVL